MYHQSLEIHAVSDVNASFVDSVGRISKGEKGIVGCVQQRILFLVRLYTL